jgi:hypothetical protein
MPLSGSRGLGKRMAIKEQRCISGSQSILHDDDANVFDIELDVIVVVESVCR